MGFTLVVLAVGGKAFAPEEKARCVVKMALDPVSKSGWDVAPGCTSPVFRPKLDCGRDKKVNPGHPLCFGRKTGRRGKRNPGEHPSHSSKQYSGAVFASALGKFPRVKNLARGVNKTGV